ncbi:hypothetical protein AMTRI_Chr04g251620 [Amborella trichopoda]
MGQMRERERERERECCANDGPPTGTQGHALLFEWIFLLLPLTLAHVSEAMDIAEIHGKFLTLN